MKFFTLGCSCCGGKDPLIAVDHAGNEVLRMFRTREDAQIEASEITAMSGGESPLVIEVEVKQTA